MFEGFTLDHADVGEARLRARHGGDGPPVVLLHGHPRTHTTWHRVAPQLASARTLLNTHSPQSGRWPATSWRSCGTLAVIASRS
jgi:haloacetate dehalogenase